MRLRAHHLEILMDEEALIEVWTRLKPFIGKNDAITAADAFVASLDEHGLIDIDEHTVLAIEDHILKEAIVSYYGFEFDDEDEYE